MLNLPFFAAPQPAVNAGILWIAYAYYENDILFEGDGPEEPTKPLPVAPFSAELGEEGGGGGGGEDDNGDKDYSRVDYNRMGMYSILLTIANIVLIYLSSILMFRMKEVLPIKKKIFWEDLGVARKIYTKKALLRSERLDDKPTFELPTEPQPTDETS